MVKVKLPEGQEISVLMELAEEGYTALDRKGQIAIFNHLNQGQINLLQELGCHILPEKADKKPPE